MTETAPARHANAHPVFARILNSVFPAPFPPATPADIDRLTDTDDRDALDVQDQTQAARDERIRTASEIE